MRTTTGQTLSWGVLSSATIATRFVIPVMQRSQNCRVVAIGSRDVERAERVARDLGIERAYGSYEALLEDPEIDALYNPLPNHPHVPWTTRAAEAGKHVLCEKPIALTAFEAETLLGVRERTAVSIQDHPGLPQLLQHRSRRHQEPGRHRRRGDDDVHRHVGAAGGGDPVQRSSRPAVPLGDSVRNMRVLDALVQSAETGIWQSP